MGMPDLKVSERNFTLVDGQPTRILDKRPGRVWAEILNTTAGSNAELFFGGDSLTATTGRILSGLGADGSGDYLSPLAHFMIDSFHPWGGDVYAMGYGGTPVLRVVEVYTE